MRISDWSSDVCSSDLVFTNQFPGQCRIRQADRISHPSNRSSPISTVLKLVIGNNALFPRGGIIKILPLDNVPDISLVCQGSLLISPCQMAGCCQGLLPFQKSGINRSESRRVGKGGGTTF